MKLKYFKNASFFSIVAWLMSVSAFTQDHPYIKHIFTYKTVEGHEIKANIFMMDTTSIHPVVVYLHGGGFIFGNRDQGLPDILRDELLDKGFAVVSADYRLAPETKLDEILKDVRDIVLWLQENGKEQFSINTEKIAVIGGSAAGYLALSTGYNLASPPRAIIAVSTPTDYSNVPPKGDESILKQSGPYEIVKDESVSYGDYTSRMTLWRFLARNGLALSEVFGFDVSQDTNRLKKFMLTENITSEFPPTLLLHARNDRLAPLPQVKKFQNFLEQKNVDSELYLVESGHSTRLIEGNADAREKIISFLNMYLQE